MMMMGPLSARQIYACFALRQKGKHLNFCSHREIYLFFSSHAAAADFRWNFERFFAQVAPDSHRMEFWRRADPVPQINFDWTRVDMCVPTADFTALIITRIFETLNFNFERADRI